MQVDELLAKALSLPRHERARIADELLSSIDEPADQAAAAWSAELEGRSQEVAHSAVQLTPWETVRAEVRDAIEQRRARRSPS